jgi:hypothetical protein
MVGNPDQGRADSDEVVFYASSALGMNFRFCRRPGVVCVADAVTGKGASTLA